MPSLYHFISMQLWGFKILIFFLIRQYWCLYSVTEQPCACVCICVCRKYGGKSYIYPQPISDDLLKFCTFEGIQNIHIHVLVCRANYFWLQHSQVDQFLIPVRLPTVELILNNPDKSTPYRLFAPQVILSLSTVIPHFNLLSPLSFLFFNYFSGRYFECYGTYSVLCNHFTQ